MRVKSENGVVFAGETTNVNSFCGFLASSSWVLCSKVRMSEHDESKKNEKSRLLSLLFASEDVCLGGANFVRKRTD